MGKLPLWREEKKRDGRKVNQISLETKKALTEIKGFIKIMKCCCRGGEI
tara:strand:+ start:5609 stop:5755 length:147 start_codon:yes stop_codon:yes gene_type:complete